MDTKEIGAMISMLEDVLVKLKAIAPAVESEEPEEEEMGEDSSEEIPAKDAKSEKKAMIMRIMAKE